MSSAEDTHSVPQNPHLNALWSSPLQTGQRLFLLNRMKTLPHLKHSDLGGSSSHFADLHEGHVFTEFGSTPSVRIHLWPHLKHFSLNVSLSQDLDLHLGHCSGCSILLFQTYPHLRQVNLGIFGSFQLRDLHLGHLTGFSEPRETQV